MESRHTDISRLTAELKNKAMEAGFIAIGIARAERLGHERERLREWLKRGYNAGMEWMTKNPEKRTDPRVVMPNAQSVITVALNYRNSHERPFRSARYGKISRYAWGRDYHDVLVERLEILTKWLAERITGLETKTYVDTGPVLEKAWAVKGGVGWLGKHTNVIRKNEGSWFFLGTLIVNISLQYDEPAEDHCGTCTACLDACPTGALTPYLLDAGKCISYWTIEHTGEFSGTISDRFENWIFGCDICQEVCPWNRFSRNTELPEFSSGEACAERELMDLAEISQDEFRKMFSGTPVLRAKFRGFIRNVKNAIANSITHRQYPERVNRSRKRQGTAGRF